MEINCKYEDNVILYTRCSEDLCIFAIAACAGAWIEISQAVNHMHNFSKRCLRGGVD